jgi:hypothetical protein
MNAIREVARARTVIAALLATAALLGAALWVGGRAAGRGPAGTVGPPIVCVCTETGAAFSVPSQSGPAINPRTGRATLVPAVYCPACRRWYAAPPADHRPGNPRPLRCRIHDVEMTSDGPLENDDTAPTTAQ